MATSTSLVPFTIEDLPVIGNFLYLSKLSLVINRVLIKNWPNEELQRKNYASAIDGALADAKSECVKAVDDATGAIVGFVVLARRQPSQLGKSTGRNSEEKKASAPEWMNQDLFQEVKEASASLERQSEGVERYDITYIYVQSQSRGKGVGTKLLGLCKERARAANLPLLAMPEPAGYQFFSQSGFVDKDHYDFDLAKRAVPNSGFGSFRLTSMAWSD